MISGPDRQHAVALIDEARDNGACLEPACCTLGLTARTYQRWMRGGNLQEDQRPFADRPLPANALTAVEEQAILDVCHRPAFANLLPDQTVVRLLDEESRYIALVSTFYRVLHRYHEVVPRGRMSTETSRQTNNLPLDRSQSGLFLGLHLAWWADQGRVLLLGDDPRYL